MGEKQATILKMAVEAVKHTAQYVKDIEFYAEDSGRADRKFLYEILEAVIDAGAVRFRPMLLTAMAVVVGGSVILFDPIFQGLAISLMAGEIASLLLSRMAVPIIYYLSMRHNYRSGVDDASAGAV